MDITTDWAAVIFDMDGTLVHSEPAIVRAWTTWAIEHGVTAEQLTGFHGVPTADVVRAILGPERAAFALTRINALELAETAGIVPLPGSIEALGAVAGRAAIATSCNTALARARLRASELPAPEVLVTVDDVDRGKPAPDIFLAAAARLGVDPGDCLVVEDAVQGLAAAHAAGMATLAVTTTTPADLLTADTVVTDLSKVRFLVADGRVRLTHLASGPAA